MIFPALTLGEVERFVALGERGWASLKSGQDGGAEAAFLGQVAIFPGNPEPHLSLALLEARRGHGARGIEHLRAAVVRGFRDMGRVERSEAWAGLRHDVRFEKLCLAVPLLEAEEQLRSGWSEVGTAQTPPDLSSVLENHLRMAARLYWMAPALGPRLVHLWKRKLDQNAAAQLEAYVTSRPDAPDLDGAVARLMTLYPDGGLETWQVLPAEPARRLKTVARTALDRFPDSPMRPGALACRALAANAMRDRAGRLDPQAAAAATADLEAVLAGGAGAPYARLAAVGLVQLEVEQDRWPRARERFEALDGTLRRAVREDLGPLALRVLGVPEFWGTALDGTVVDRAGLDGTVAILDFWATWCRPCEEEFTTIRKIARRHGERVRIVGVNLDRGEEVTPEALRTWVRVEGLPGHHLHDGRGWQSELVAAFGVRKIPFTVVVAADGSVRVVGAHGKVLEKAVADALRGDGRSE